MIGKCTHVYTDNYKSLCLHPCLWFRLSVIRREGLAGSEIPLGKRSGQPDSRGQHTSESPLYGCHSKSPQKGGVDRRGDDRAG